MLKFFQNARAVNTDLKPKFFIFFCVGIFRRAYEKNDLFVRLDKHGGVVLLMLLGYFEDLEKKNTFLKL